MIVSDDGLVFRCPNWDSGWCYAKPYMDSNDDEGKCNNPKQCNFRIEHVVKVVRLSND